MAVSLPMVPVPASRRRSPGDVERRRALADAAAGSFGRVRVVAYLCSAEAPQPVTTGLRLRRHAADRCWELIALATDADPATPLGDRPGMIGALAELSVRGASVLLTDSVSLAAVSASDRGTLIDFVQRSGRCTVHVVDLDGGRS